MHISNESLFVRMTTMASFHGPHYPINNKFEFTTLYLGYKSPDEYETRQRILPPYAFIHPFQKSHDMTRSPIRCFV